MAEERLHVKEAHGSNFVGGSERRSAHFLAISRKSFQRQRIDTLASQLLLTDCHEESTLLRTKTLILVLMSQMLLCNLLKHHKMTDSIIPDGDLMFISQF